MQVHKPYLGLISKVYPLYTVLKLVEVQLLGLGLGLDFIIIMVSPCLQLRSRILYACIKSGTILGLQKA